MFWIGVEPVTEHTIVSAFRSSTLAMSESVPTRRPWPVTKYGPAKSICSLRESVIE